MMSPAAGFVVALFGPHASADVNVTVLTIDSATKLPPEARGAVVVTGSHGATYAAYLSAKAGVRAAIHHDAGIGPATHDLRGGRAAVAAGHVDVHDHHVGLVLCEEVERIGSMAALGHDLDPVPSQPLAHALAEARVVVREQHADGLWIVRHRGPD